VNFWFRISLHENTKEHEIWPLIECINASPAICIKRQWPFFILTLLLCVCFLGDYLCTKFVCIQSIQKRGFTLHTNKIIIKCRHNLIKTKTLSVNVSLSWYIILEGGQNMKALIQKYISWMRKINSFISWKNGQTIC